MLVGQIWPLSPLNWLLFSASCLSLLQLRLGLPAVVILSSSLAVQNSPRARQTKWPEKLIACFSLGLRSSALSRLSRQEVHNSDLPYSISAVFPSQRISSHSRPIHPRPLLWYQSPQTQVINHILHLLHTVLQRITPPS